MSLQAHRSGHRRSVDALVNYLAPTNIRPQVWNEDFSRNVLPLEATSIQIEDVSFGARPPSLDEEGFALVRHGTAVSDLAEGSASMQTYHGELHDMLVGLTGADHIDMANNSPVRRAENIGRANHDAGLPVPFIHCDCSEKGVWYMLEWAYPPPPERKITRVVLYNLWRLLSPGPTDLPLAVCDARTVAPGDVVPGDSHFLTSGISFESGFVRANPAHRWCYFSRMTADDVLIFKQYDSDRRYALQCPHAAFSDPSCPPGAAPRVSIESRAVCYWYA